VKAVNLSKLIHEVWKDDRTRELRLRKDEVRILAEVFVDHIGKGLLKYGIVKLQGLFTLDVRKAKGRKISNPQTKEIMYSKDYHKVGVIPSKKIKDGLKKYNK
jgi:nucleoid DNA-binding protein